MKTLQNFSFFDFFDVLNEETMKEETKDVTDSVLNVLSDVDFYIKKGEILETLARERYRHNEEDNLVSDVEETLYSIKVTQEDTLADIIYKINRKVIRPLLRGFDDKNSESFKLLSTLIHDDFGISLRTLSRESISYQYVGKRIDPNDVILELTIRENGYQPLQIIGTKNAPHSSNRKNVLYQNGILVADLGEVLSFLVILSQVKNEFLRIKELSETDRMCDTTYCLFKTIQDEMNVDYVKMGALYNEYFPNGTSVFECEAWCLEKPLSYDGFILPCILSRFHRPSISFKNKKIMQHAYQTVLENCMKTNALNEMPIYLTRKTSQHLYAVCFLDILDISYHDFLSMHNNYFWPFISLSAIKRYKSDLSNFMPYCVTRMYHVLHEEKTECVKRTIYQKQSNKDYATVFKQKKNIPQKVLSAMAASLFNKYFGYVEIDSDCDIMAVEEVAKEFVALKEQYLSFVDSSEHSIRIRKLGQHKAYGLYSSYHKCLCIDISSPSSLMHEYGHLIDYEYNNLSLKQNFREIRSWYSDFLKRKMLKGLESLSGKGKYNLDYFLTPTEIFARAFEIYLTDILNVHNSIVKREYDFAYPDDKQFISLVEKYFTGLFAKLISNTVSNQVTKNILAVDAKQKKEKNNVSKK